MLPSINGKYKRELIHRLVALTFIDNPDNLPCVNHKDENKENNVVSNLEWCSRSYNINYGTRNERASKALSKAILCIETGEIFTSGKECAESLGTSPDIVSKVLHGKSRYKTANGYHLKFVN